MCPRRSAAPTMEAGPALSGVGPVFLLKTTLTPLAHPDDNPGMNDKATKRGGGAVVVVALVAVLVVLPMLYVLSSGPVCAMVNKGWIDQSWEPVIETAYWPLGWSAEHVPVFGLAVDSYVEWWSSPNQAVYAAPPTALLPPRTAPTPAPAGQSGQ